MFFMKRVRSNSTSTKGKTFGIPGEIKDYRMLTNEFAEILQSQRRHALPNAIFTACTVVFPQM